MALPPPVLALSPGDLRPERVPTFARAAVRARECGIAGLVLREPHLDDAPLFELARALRRVYAPGEAFLAVHDRLHVALAAEADGCHLGWRSLAPSAARDALRAAGRELAVSRSTHADDAAEAWDACDWVVHGPVRAVEKDVPLAPTGFDGLAAFARRCAVPTWALGGLDADDARACREAGARGMALRRAVWRADEARLARVARAWEDAS